MRIAILGVLVASAALLTANTALAGCSPPCKNGDICRYEAAGKGKFYCAPPAAQSKGGKSKN